MCGFAGVISFSDACRIDPARAGDLTAGLAADLAHRGPDGQGDFRLRIDEPHAFPSPGAPQALLVHRRLAVIDPVPRSDQPFIAGDGRLVAVFNGEIYNYRALRDELSAASGGRSWRTEGDTEVLLAAYEAWGDRCVERLEGMFAFAILDLREQGEPRLFLARDPAGEKPLFLAVRTLGEPTGQNGEPAAATIGAGPVAGVAFASELAALRRIDWIDL